MAIVHPMSRELCNCRAQKFPSGLHAAFSILSVCNAACIVAFVILWIVIYFNINPLAPELFFFNFSTSCIQNVNNTGTKQVSIMKQTAF